MTISGMRIEESFSNLCNSSCLPKKFFIFFSRRKIIQTLIDKENIRYEIIKLKNPNALYQIKNLAIKKEPPFVSRNGSDKGFKDAYIYFTVLEYLQNTSDKYLFFITTDSLLKAAFEEHRRN
jgi:hypothetical protein